MKTQSVLMPLVGIGTVAATTLAGVVPGVAVSPGGDAPSTVDASSTVGVANGTLEACSEYFGFGKATDLVAFDVQVVEGETPDPAPTFENGGVDIVLVLGNEDGDELRCLPSEVTEEEWDDFWDTYYEEELIGEPPAFRPPWPGPGHYYYPALNVPPVGEDEPTIVRVGAPWWREPIDEFGEVTEVGFEVVGVKAPLTVVTPKGYQALNQVVTDAVFEIFEPCFSSDYTPTWSPNLLARIDDLAGPAASSALTDLFDVDGLCTGPPDEDPLVDAGPLAGPEVDDLLAAARAMLAIIGYTSDEIDAIIESLEELPEDNFPFALILLGGLTTPVADFDAAADNTATIALAAPTIPDPPAPLDPEPEVAVPRFTG
jgi:hypothetical protein